MEEKVKMLSDYLPNLMVENKKIYSIISKGIHELSEKECLKYFETMKLSIELILDEKLKEREKLEKEKSIEKEIGKITGEIK